MNQDINPMKHRMDMFWRFSTFHSNDSWRFITFCLFDFSIWVSNRMFSFQMKVFRFSFVGMKTLMAHCDLEARGMSLKKVASYVCTQNVWTESRISDSTDKFNTGMRGENQKKNIQQNIRKMKSKRPKKSTTVCFSAFLFLG